MEALIGLVLLQSINGVIVFYVNRKGIKSSGYLLWLFALIFIHQLFKGILLYAFTDEEVFKRMHGGFSFLYGPLLWFYVQSVSRGVNVSLQFIKHTIPFLVAILFNVILLSMQMMGAQVLYVMMRVEVFFLLFLSLSLFIYGVLSIRFVLRNITSFSIFERRASLTIAGTFISLSSILVVAYVFKFNGEYDSTVFRFVFYGCLLVMLFIVLIFSVSKRAEQVKKTTKYKSYTICEEELSRIVIKVKDYLFTSKKYLDCDYSISQLSEELGIEKIKLTQAINLHLNRNFYGLINEMRVQYAKWLLETTEEANMTVIGIESGFKNKSTFYKYFKEYYQVSPGDYKRLNKNGNN